MNFRGETRMSFCPTLEGGSTICKRPSRERISGKGDGESHGRCAITPARNLLGADAPRRFRPSVLPSPRLRRTPCPRAAVASAKAGKGRVGSVSL
jgi:hypothetical protein